MSPVDLWVDIAVRELLISRNIRSFFKIKYLQTHFHFIHSFCAVRPGPVPVRFRSGSGPVGGCSIQFILNSPKSQMCLTGFLHTSRHRAWDSKSQTFIQFDFSKRFFFQNKGAGLPLQTDSRPRCTFQKAERQCSGHNPSLQDEVIRMIRISLNRAQHVCVYF